MCVLEIYTTSVFDLDLQNQELRCREKKNSFETHILHVCVVQICICDQEFMSCETHLSRDRDTTYIHMFHMYIYVEKDIDVLRNESMEEDEIYKYGGEGVNDTYKKRKHIPPHHK